MKNIKLVVHPGDDSRVPVGSHTLKSERKKFEQMRRMRMQKSMVQDEFDQAFPQVSGAGNQCQMYSPLELYKAKYTRRWRGKDGKYRYEYGSQTSRAPRMMTSKEVDAARDQVRGIQRGRISLSPFQDEPIRPNKISVKGHKKLNVAVGALSGNSYKEIPIQKFNSVLKKEGYVLLQPGDGREWPKNRPFFKPGEKVKAKDWTILPIGNLGLSGKNGLGQKTYIGMGSTQLKIKWWKQPDGKFKVKAGMMGPYDEY